MGKFLKNFFMLIRRNKLELYLSAGILFGSMLIGFLILKFSPSIYNNDITNTYMKDTDSLSIIKNNLSVGLSLICGNLSLGITPLITLFYSGFSCGMMLEVHSNNLSMYTILSKTLFHGIFELPGIIVCGGIGLKSLTICIKSINRKKIDFKINVKDSLILCIFSMIMIIVGGFIEGNIVTLF